MPAGKTIKSEKKYLMQSQVAVHLLAVVPTYVIFVRIVESIDNGRLCCPFVFYDWLPKFLYVPGCLKV